MVHVQILEKGYDYEILDVLKLFYPQNEIVLSSSRPPDSCPGVFLLIEPLMLSGKKHIRILLRTGSFNLESLVSCQDNIFEEDFPEKRKNIKRELKRQIYLLISKVSERNLPWGMLTGIRPAKIVHEMLKYEDGEEAVIGKLTEYYRVSANKAKLLYDTARAEEEVLRRAKENSISIYIGIPFCPTRCLYCSFTSNPISKCQHLVDAYLDALKKEINGVREIIDQNRFKIQSIYIGGGTPTSIDVKELSGLLESVETAFDLKALEEYTLEAGRPDSIDDDKLKAVKDSMVTRISINPQTMNDGTLLSIGRSHTARDVVRAFNLARDRGFDNINMDIIAGLPGESKAMFMHTLSEIRKLSPESLTVHTMAVKKASRLKEEIENISLTCGREVSDMLEAAYNCALAMGMHPYYLYRQKNILGNLENTGYSKPGFEGIYNIQNMEEKQTIIALGAGAVSKVVYHEENRIERVFNVKNVEQYILRIDEMLERKRQMVWR